MYRRIVDGDLVIAVPEAGGDVTEGPLLTVMGPNALQHPNRSFRIGDATKRGIPLLLPDEFVGRPSMQVPLYQIGRRVWRFQVNRPVRMYAYIRFPLEQPPPDEWQIYHRSPFQPQVLSDVRNGTPPLAQVPHGDRDHFRRVGDDERE